MIIQTLILLAVLLFLYFFIWRPWKLRNWYIQNFKQHGYKVLEVPFRPFSMNFFNYYDFSPSTTDAMKRIKEEYPQYDVVVMN